MSINAMAESVVQARVRERKPDASRAPSAPGGGLEVTSSPLDSDAPARDESRVGESVKQIAEHIPTEILGTYLVVIGLVATSVPPVQWALYALFLLLAPLAVWAATWAKAKRTEAPVKNASDLPVWRMLVAALAFAVWAAAFPGSVFNTLDWYSPELGSALLVIVAFLVGLLAPAFGDK